jgi:hypothetical protein
LRAGAPEEKLKSKLHMREQQRGYSKFMEDMKRKCRSRKNKTWI